jgi:cytochrome c nitrite reductase small subunit
MDMQEANETKQEQGQQSKRPFFKWKLPIFRKQGLTPEKSFFTVKFPVKSILIKILIPGVLLGMVGFVGEQKVTDIPQLCPVCHNMQTNYDTWNSGHLEANKHAAAGVTCHDCHESSIPTQVEQLWKYATGDYKTPIEKRQFGTRVFCGRCHDLATVISKTTLVNVSTFADENPHNSHIGFLECNMCHSEHNESQLSCKQCHTFEWENTLAEYFKK